jgi:hypothetical protein
MESLARAHSDVLELSEFPVDDEDLERVEEELGHPLPDDLRSLLRIGDGGALHLPHAVVHLANIEQLAEWAAAGVHDELDAVPFAHDASGTVFVLDVRGEWGQPPGGVYRVRSARRPSGRVMVRDAVRLASTLSEFIAHVGAGRDAF